MREESLAEMRNLAREFLAAQHKAPPANIDEMMEEALKPKKKITDGMTPAERTAYFKQNGDYTFGLPEGWRWPRRQEMFDDFLTMLRVGTKVVSYASDATKILEDGVNVLERLGKVGSSKSTPSSSHSSSSPRASAGFSASAQAKVKITPENIADLLPSVPTTKPRS